MSDFRHRYAIQVDVGDGAVHAIPNPHADPHVERMLRYSRDLSADPSNARLVAADILASFDYLLSGHITMKEATRRLRLLRRVRAREAKG